MRIRRRELNEIANELPAIAPWEEEDSRAAGDIFVCALGFEPRCLALPEMLAATAARYRFGVKLRFSTNLLDNVRNESQLDNALGVVCKEVIELNADQPEFTSELRRLLQASRRNSSEDLAVTLDISVFANRLVMRSMSALLHEEVTLRVGYCEAKNYYPTREEYLSSRSAWNIETVLGLERGVAEVATSIDHPGYHFDRLPDKVILFPSFKAERSMAVVSAIDPSILLAPSKKLVWVLGKPHLPENSWRLDAMKEINGIPAEALTYEVSTFNYLETLHILENIYERFADESNLTISPLGSKLQALGTSLFCRLRPDVRVVFAVPKEYNALHYSTGVEAVWKIRLGDTDSLGRRLASVGELVMGA